MFRMCASNSHSYTLLILPLGIVREPTVWVCITSKYPGMYDIGLPTNIINWVRFSGVGRQDTPGTCAAPPVTRSSRRPCARPYAATREAAAMQALVHSSAHPLTLRTHTPLCDRALLHLSWQGRAGSSNSTVLVR